MVNCHKCAAIGNIVEGLYYDDIHHKPICSVHAFEHTYGVELVPAEHGQACKCGGTADYICKNEDGSLRYICNQCIEDEIEHIPMWEEMWYK